MFVQNLLKKRICDDPQVYINMNNIETNVKEEHHDVIIMDGQGNTINRSNERTTNDVSNSTSNRNEDREQQNVVSTAKTVDNGKPLRSRDNKLVEHFIVAHISQLTNPYKNADKQDNPIIEYAKEPLLPLAEACFPLNNIIHNLPTYVQSALNETPQHPPDGLTFDESAAIRLYTIEWDEPHTSLYSMLNYTLKKSNRQALSPYYKYLKLLLTALVKLPCAPMQTVWRGVTKDLSEEFPDRTKVTWWAFSSCTASLPVLESNVYLGNAGERTLFSVEAMNGRIIRAHSHFDFEDEILLLPGTYMEVQSKLSPASGLHIIHLKQMKPTETLLEPPFEGALLYPPEQKKVSWYKNKRTIAEISLLIGLCIAGIIVGSVLGTRRPPPPPICRTRTINIKADLFWSFDCGDAREDFKGINNGTAENGASYSSPDFSGTGKALNLDRKLIQYVRLPYSLNLTVNTSFTMSTWIFLTGTNSETILSDCNTFNPICIDFVVYSVLIFARISNLTSGNEIHRVQYDAWQIICQSCWIHLAFTFDNKTNLLSIYFNGVLMQTGTLLSSTSVTMATNNNRTTYIGAGSVPALSSPYTGLIDQLSISYYVKNSSDILQEASLVCYYNFETDDINFNLSPNNILTYSENVNRSTMNNQSNLVFNSNDSYFQASGFTLLMSKTYAFTIAFWIRPIIMKPDKLNSAIAIFQLVSKVEQVSSESYVCFISLSLNNITGNQPYFQYLFGQLNMFTALDHNTIENNTWNHVGVSYGGGYQISFYLNGENLGYINDTRFSLLLYDPRLALTIGGNYFDDLVTVKPTNYESRLCFTQNPEFNYTQLNGEIDNVRVYSRVLTNAEFATLASSKNRTIS